MSTIRGVTRFKIHPGKSEEFKRLAARCLQLVREKDTGTLRYELFLNAEETECVLHGEYVDFEASVQHFKNMGDAGMAVFAITEAEYEMWGDPGPEAGKAVRDRGCRLYLPFLSLGK
jgi:quinol monooxygenase YgiN